MAIDLNGADFNSLFGVTEIAERGLRGVNALNLLELSGSLDTDNLIQHIIDNLDTKITLLKESEEKFLSMFDCRSTQQFKDRIKNYYNYTNLYKFTGTQLDVLIKDFLGQVDKTEQYNDALIMKMIYNLAETEFAQRLPKDFVDILKSGEVTQELVNQIQNVLRAALSGSSYGKGGVLTSSKAFLTLKTGVDGKKYLQVMSKKTTEAFNQHLESMKKQLDTPFQQIRGYKNRQEARRAKQLLKGSSKIKYNEDSFTQTFVVDWSKLIQEATITGSGREKDIKDKYLDKNNKATNELKELNARIIQHILTYLDPPSELKSFAEKRLTYMCEQKPTLFFIGKASNSLIGVLGEINAVIAITDLLGKNYKDEVLSWVGGVNEKQNGPLPSVDIVLKDIAHLGDLQFGIQIKNTAKDLEVDFSHYVGFADKSVEKTFEELGIFEGNALRNVYIADEYNVPTKRIGNKYEQVSYNTIFEDTTEQATFLDYVRIDKLIDQIVSDINLFLTLFASDFLYMGLGENFKSKLAALNAATEKTGGNFVYIVGKEVFFAHDILLQLQNDLKGLLSLQKEQQQMSFKLEAYIEKLKEDKGHFTIVDAWNGNGHLSAHTIKLRSGFVFQN